MVSIRCWPEGNTIFRTWQPPWGSGSSSAWRSSTRAVAPYYELWGEDPPLRLPERGDAGHSWHVFTPLLPLTQLTLSRAQFMEAMKARGIGTGVHYPAIHLFSAYRALGYREGRFPNAERIGRETLTLPLFPAMQLSDVDRVVAAVNDIVRGARR